MGSSVIFMFSGQGSQYYQMGRPFFEDNPVFRHWMLKLDKLVEEMIGESVVDRLYDPAHTGASAFDRTLYTHPAIFMVEYALAQVLIKKGIEPDAVLGASLGEFAAAAMAGVMKPEQALEAVVWQAQQLEAHCSPGRMLAVVYAPRLFEDDRDLFADTELAGIHYDVHFVIAGTEERLRSISKTLRAQRISSLMLPVQHAFHSALIDPAGAAYLAQLESRSFAAPTLPFYSSLYGQRIERLPKDYFWQAVRKQIRFADAIRAVMGEGEAAYLDVGPAGTLANFAKRVVKGQEGSSVHAILTPVLKHANVQIFQ